MLGSINEPMMMMLTILLASWEKRRRLEGQRRWYRGEEARKTKKATEAEVEGIVKKKKRLFLLPNISY